MNNLLFLLSSMSVLLLKIECDSVFDLPELRPYYSEFFSLIYKRHQSRIRQFRNLFGTSISNTRAGRSISEEEHAMVKCVYAFESLFCAGIDQTGKEIKIECDAREDFKNAGLGDVTRYALSDIRVLKTGVNSVITKMYMFGQKENTTTWMNYLVKDQWKNRNIVSVHTTDSSSDQGLTVLDSNCWDSMVAFFKAVQSYSEVNTNEELGVKIIAVLNILYN